MTQKNKSIVVETKELSKYYGSENAIRALESINLVINKGEFVGLIGPSGSGKTTLINAIAGILKPSSGYILIDNQNLSEMDDDIIRDFRLRNIGMIFQEHLLVDSLTSLENIELPLVFARSNFKERRKKSRELIKRMGLKGKERNLPSDLSGGEQQRVGVARSLMNDPIIILADEPTGDLDTKTGNSIIKLFRQIVDEDEVSIIMVSHDPRHQKHFDRVINLLDGKIVN